MSDKWIESNLSRDFGFYPTKEATKKMGETIDDSGYLGILLVVDESGKVISSSEVNEFGKVIGGYKL